MIRWILLIIFGLACVGALAGARGQTGENVDVRSGINHGEFDRLLKKYVNERGLVNYGAWKLNKADLAAFEDYLKQFARKADNPAQDNARRLSHSSTLTTRSCFAGFSPIIQPKAFRR